MLVLPMRPPLARSRLGFLAFVFTLTAGPSCRRRAAPTGAEIHAEPSSVPAPVASASASDASAPHVDGVSAVPPPARPTPPVLACTVDAHVRWKVIPPPTEVNGDTGSLDSGPAGFACSPYQTALSPLELTMAPGTILEMPLEVEVAGETSDPGDSGAFEDPPAAVTYVSAGLPKGAWIDPATRSLKWHVRGAEGEVFAMTVGAKVAFSEGQRCVTAPIVVRIRDDEATRKAQASVLDREEANGMAVVAQWSTLSSPTPEFLEFVRSVRCGAVAVEPDVADADRDGLSDAIFVYPSRGGGFPTESGVFLRRGDTFVNVGRANGRVERAPDGTTFLVDLSSDGTGYPISIGVHVVEVFPNRLQEIAHETTNTLLGDGAEATGGIDLDHAAGAMIGFHDRATSASGALTIRTWRWDGKRFAQRP